MKLFVWDLHGTLEQGNEYAAIEMSNQILDRFGYSERFTEGHVHELYGLKWHQYFEHLLPAESPDRHFELQGACFTLSNSPAGAQIIARHMTPAPHAVDTLSAIKKSGHRQVLMSNTVEASVPLYLRALKFNDYFRPENAIAIDQHAKDAKQTKLSVLQSYLKDESFDHLIVIGDSAGDMALAQGVGATGYLYAHPGVAFRAGWQRRLPHQRPARRPARNLSP